MDDQMAKRSSLHYWFLISKVVGSIHICVDRSVPNQRIIVERLVNGRSNDSPLTLFPIHPVACFGVNSSVHVIHLIQHAP